MKETQLENLSQLIPEFYFDLIGRIIPGALALAVYRWDVVGGLESLGQIFVGLLFSYLLGTLLDIGSDILLGRFIFRVVFFALKSMRYSTLFTDAEIWPRIRQLGERQIVIFNKMMAEKAMLRGTILVNVIAIFYPPMIIPKDNVLLICLISLIALLFCHFSLQLYISERIRHAEARPTSA